VFKLLLFSILHMLSHMGLRLQLRAMMKEMQRCQLRMPAVDQVLWPTPRLKLLED